MRRARHIVLALALGGCVVQPLDLSHRRALHDGAAGPPRPGRSGQLGDEDWRHGEQRPPHVDPDTLLEATDLTPQLGAPRADDGPRAVFYGSSDEDGAAGAIVIPF